MADTPNTNKPLVAMDTRGNDFYRFFRSGNHHEMQQHLVKLSNNSSLDRHDLALLSLMLAQYLSDTYTRRQFMADDNCKDALVNVLCTVRKNEAALDGRPNEKDVDEITAILNASSAIY